MSQESKSLGYHFILFVSAILLSIPIVIFKAYVVTTLWWWFVVPTFNVTSLSIVPTIGMIYLLSVLKWEYKPTKNKETGFKDVISAFVTGIVVYGFALGIGKFITLFM